MIIFQKFDRMQPFGSDNAEHFVVAVLIFISTAPKNPVFYNFSSSLPSAQEPADVNTKSAMGI
ncbi:MAG: hypothetical protein LV471_05155 [Nitrosomonas sp.]|nr:hypothetical protein [Nitrosomonas sp.]